MSLVLIPSVWAQDSSNVGSSELQKHVPELLDHGQIKIDEMNRKMPAVQKKKRPASFQEFYDQTMESIQRFWASIEEYLNEKAPKQTQSLKRKFGWMNQNRDFKISETKNKFSSAQFQHSQKIKKSIPR